MTSLKPDQRDYLKKRLQWFGFQTQYQHKTFHDIQSNPEIWKQFNTVVFDPLTTNLGFKNWNSITVDDQMHLSHYYDDVVVVKDAETRASTVLQLYRDPFGSLGRKMGGVLTPETLVNQLLRALPSNVWSDPDLKWIDPHCGRGVFMVAIQYLLYHGLKLAIPDGNERLRHINSNMIYINDIRPEMVDLAREVLSQRKFSDSSPKPLLNYSVSNALEKPLFGGKKFDVVVGNPPWNSAAGGITGTGGDTYFYRRFTDLSISLLNDTGKLAYITPKGIIRYIKQLDIGCDYLNLMTDYDYWNFDSCIFCLNKAHGNKLGLKKISDNSFISKIVSFDDTFEYYIRNNPDKPFNKNKIVTKKVYGLLKLKNSKNNEIYGEIDNDLAFHGPKFITTLQYSRQSHTITALPSRTPHSILFIFKSIDEARRFELFVEKNLLIDYLYSKLKLNSKMAGKVGVMTLVKKFDLNQIQTGFEIPKEWELRDEDIESLKK